MFQAITNFFQQSWASVGQASTGSQYYDALKDTGTRRKNPAFNVRHADNKLHDRDRRLLIAKVWDIYDNNPVLAWMIDTHVAMIASLSFRAQTTSRRFNKNLEAFVKWWSAPENCHAQAKLSLPQLVCQLERQNVMAGDCLVVKFGGRNDIRGTIQLIESDRIKNRESKSRKAGYSGDTGRQGTETTLSGMTAATDSIGGRWFNGVQLDRYGRASRYAVHRKTVDGQLEFERYVQAENAILYGTFDRPDQIRGITPLTNSLNHLQDTNEAMRLVLGKLKVAQSMAAFITRDSDMPLDPERVRPTRDSQASGYADADYEFEMDDGVNIFELNRGEGVTTVQDNTASGETNQFIDKMIMTSLKGLGIPFSFWSEDFTNWYGQKSASDRYRGRCADGTMSLAHCLNQILRWRLDMAIADGQLEVPMSVDLDEMPWTWVPRGTGYIDPAKEVAGYKAAVAAGFDSPYRVTTALGNGDLDEILEDRARAEKRAKQLGVTLDYALSTSSSTSHDEPEEENDEQEMGAEVTEGEGSDEDGPEASDGDVDSPTEELVAL